MRRSGFALTLLLLCICSLASPVGAGQKGRALSLRQLEATLRAGGSPQAQALGGLTRVLGFVVDPTGHDIILVGQADPAYPPLQADDFIVALRFAHMKYARRQGRALYYTPPGCSIDPDPEVLAQLRQVGTGRGSSDEDRLAIAAEWETVGRQPQTVRVMGVPFYTHFAKVMVDADYDMKRLSNGSADPSVAGFTGLLPLRASQAKLELASEGGAPAESGHTLDRFWFCPADATYEEQDRLFLLRTCQIQLLTEEEFLAAGKVQGLGRPSPLARQFAQSFTQKYDEIAAARPIYRQLEALFRFVAVARLIADTHAGTRSGNRLSYLLSGYQVPNVPVARALPGQTRVVSLEEPRATGQGTKVHYVTLLSCGGVSMDVRPRKVASRPAARPRSRTGSRTTAPASSGRAAKRASAAPKAVVASRPSGKALSWDIELPD